jgi:transcriptional regulator with XRE-family HTH domain
MNLNSLQKDKMPEAKVFRHLRVAAGMSTRQLSKLLGCTSSFITHYETMRDPLPKPRIKQLCHIFSINSEELESLREGNNLPMNYRDECSLLISKMDEQKLKAVYGILVNMNV